MLDYYLKSPAKELKLEIFDAGNQLVRRFSSGQKPPEEKRPPLPMAERWLPKPVVLENTPGMHRLVWDLRWSSSGTQEIEEDESFGAPRGPRVTPGIYSVKLRVDGQTFTQSLKVEMDPRSHATQAELDEQQRLGLEIFGEAHRVRRVLAEIAAVKKHLGEVKPQLAGKNTELMTQVTNLETAIATLEKGSKAPVASAGLETASTGLASALRVVESSDRTVPSQAIELYQQSAEAAKAGIAGWTKLKSTQLIQLNDALRNAGLAPVQISAIERDMEYLMSE